jgi:3-hydroxybutyryl-CoA dehydrogenase
MIDIKEEFVEKGMSTIKQSLNKLVSKGRMSEKDAELAISRISTSTENSSASDADLVVEAIPEVLSYKTALFEQLDDLCKPGTILATNTSSISIDSIAASTSRPDKVIGMHFMNPVPIMKLVEVINSKYTSKETTDMIITISEQLEKIPLVVNDFPGFISNRILMPMINEAIESLDQGVSGVKNIDGIMKLGMGHPMGPLQLADLIGLDVCKSILEVMFDGLKNPKYKPNKLLIELVNNGKLGIKSGEGFYDYSDSKKAEFVSKRFN